MGYYSDVKLVITKEGYDRLKKFCEESDEECVRNMLTEDTIFNTSNDNANLPEGFVSVEWQYVKWYNTFKDVSAVCGILSELDEEVEKDPKSLDKWCYKLIEIGEDNSTYETTNDNDEEFLGDFYVNCYFSY